MQISKKKINYCKEGNFFWIKWKDNPKDNYEQIMAKPLFAEVVHSLEKQGYQVID
jgi:hypothetical protein